MVAQDSQYYYTVILITQIIVSSRGNIGSCEIYCAIVTRDVKSCCTVRGLRPLERKKLVKNKMFVIDLKFTQYIPMMVSDIVYQ